MALILKRRTSARWQARERLPDAALCRAAREMHEGLVDADLGALLYKKRIARFGGGKRDGYRTVLAARFGCRYVFLHGFGKNEKANITADERRALHIAGRAFLDASLDDLAVAIRTGVLLEVKCEQDH